MVLSVDDHLNQISYAEDRNYVPSDFAIQYVNFIKQVAGPDGEENESPVIHMRMLDVIAEGNKDIANLCARGLAKTTLFGEMLFLWIAVHGGLGSVDKIRPVKYALYVSDSVENGVKRMRERLQLRMENSEFLKKVIKEYHFTQNRWEWVRVDGERFVVTGHGAATGVRGTQANKVRPQLAILDDLMSDSDARSPTVINNIRHVVYAAVSKAMLPGNHQIVWSGTPFNAKDPLYEAVNSGGWDVNVFPVCEKFPCEPEEFRSAWPDRFSYNAVKRQYEKDKAAGTLHLFNQELMLRIMSDEERLIQPEDILWFDRDMLQQNRSNYNFYITTDFATSDKQSADYSVINVWAISGNGDWLLVDSYCKKALMSENIDKLFVFVKAYKPLSVGVEVTGQQGGFIAWIRREMIARSIHFSLASSAGKREVGIRPTKDKMSRFQQTVVPQFQSRKVWLPEQLKDTAAIQELLSELEMATYAGFKSKHDDQLDTLSMLGEMQTIQPSVDAIDQPLLSQNNFDIDRLFGHPESAPQGTHSYFVH